MPGTTQSKSDKLSRTTVTRSSRKESKATHKSAITNHVRSKNLVIVQSKMDINVGLRFEAKEIRQRGGATRAVTSLSIPGGQDNNIPSSFLIFL